MKKIAKKEAYTKRARELTALDSLNVSPKLHYVVKITTAMISPPF